MQTVSSSKSEYGNLSDKDVSWLITKALEEASYSKTGNNTEKKMMNVMFLSSCLFCSHFERVSWELRLSHVIIRCVFYQGDSNWI